MTEPTKPLEEVRREIDEIDAAIHDLILRRTRLISQVAAAKGQSGGTNVMPGREARVLRRLLARHDGPFPRVSLIRIWRELISVYAAMQGPYDVVAYADGDNQACWDLARDQFGIHDKITTAASRREVVARVVDGETALGVVPLPENDNDDEGWWRSLCAADAPRVVGRLPFVGGSNARAGDSGAYAIARVVLDESGDDRSLLVVEGEITGDALRTLLTESGLQPAAIASHREAEWSHLAEIGGFLAPDDPVLRKLAAAPGVVRAVCIGGYAVPADLAETAS